VVTRCANDLSLAVDPLAHYPEPYRTRPTTRKTPPSHHSTVVTPGIHCVRGLLGERVSSMLSATAAPQLTTAR
jgi:hypothetical protein